MVTARYGFYGEDALVRLYSMAIVKVRSPNLCEDNGSVNERISQGVNE